MIIYPQPISKGGAERVNRPFYGKKQRFICTYATPRLAANTNAHRVAPSLRACSSVRRSVPIVGA